MSRPRVALGRALRIAFGLAGAAFLILAFLRTWDGSAAEVAVDWWRPPAAALLAAVGLRCGFGGWATLVGQENGRALAWGFYLSQLGKYIPGGVWQAVGQVGYTARANVSVPRATTSFAVFAVTQAAAGGVIGAAVSLLFPGLSTAVRLAAAAGLLLALLLYRRWMVLAVSLIRRLRRHDDAERLVPAQRRIVQAAAWSVGTMAANGLAFTLLLGGLETGTPAVHAVAASSLAWTAGFLVLPVPAGIGVREAVLLLILGPTVATPVLIVASVYQRLATIAAEGVMIPVSRWAPTGLAGSRKAPSRHPP